MARPERTDSHVYTIPPHLAFMESVAKGVLKENAGDPLKLADYTILVPNRDAASALRLAFTREMAGKPVILPRIGTPGDLDDEDLSLRVSADKFLSSMLMDIPPAVPHLQRQLLLAAEILKIPGMASSPRKAVTLGGELGRFIDEAGRHSVDLKNIDSLVAPEFKAQWARTAEFLKIVTDIWPKQLEAMGRSDPEDHKNAVIHVQSAYWRAHPPATPVIAAGFTETAPAILGLLETVAALPKGSVVLPAVDLAMDGKSWDAVSPVHPQYAVKKTLSALNVLRGDVQAWDKTAAPKRASEREKLLRAAMQPAGVPVPEKKIAATALKGLTLSIAGTPQEEASLIALEMRQTLETPGSTAMLVTEDRALARRVAARLKHWDIDVADSGGASLGETPAGIYLAGTAQMAAENLAPVPLLSALKNPLAALGMMRGDFRRTLADIEDKTLHGPRPRGGVDGLKGALTKAFNRAARRSGLDDKTKLRLAAEQKADEAWLEKFDAAGRAFFGKMAGRTAHPFKDLLDSHIRFAETLAADDKDSGAKRLWRGDDGARAAQFLSELRDAAGFLPPVTGQDYADVLQGLMRDVRVHPKSEKHPQLHILSPEQALFAKADKVIMGGLAADVWPRRAEENPWLSPAMARSLGFPPAEENIGLAAQRFTRLAAGEDVSLTRAERTAEAPALASPFVTRLRHALKIAGFEGKIENASDLPDINAALHKPAMVTPVEPPAPEPAAELRPKELPVTAIETLMRDPYAVYARYVLKLRAKPPIDAGPSVSERGTLTHAALEKFVKTYPDKLPDDAYDQLLTIGEDTFRDRMDSPAVRSFWWPRFERIASWFVKFETDRREVSHTLGTEVRGRLDIDLGDEVFSLTCIADRVDRGEDGRLEIIDYKTGGVPSQKAVALGFSPQLTLEASIAFEGKLGDIEPGETGSLQFWKLSGARPAGAVIEVKGDVKALTEQARAGVEKLARAFSDPATPFLAAPRQEWTNDYNNYRHLEREAEWSTVRKTGRATTPKTRKGGPKR